MTCVAKTCPSADAAHLDFYMAVNSNKKSKKYLFSALLQLK